MKNLKYFLFTLVVVFISLSRVNAACVFGNDTLNFTCSESNRSVSCSIGGTGAGNYNLKSYSNVTADSVKACNGIMMRSDADPSVIITRPDVYLYSVGETPPYDKDFNKPVDTPLPGTTVENVSKEEQAQETLKKYNGETCIYGSGVFKYICTIKNGKPSCSFGCADGSLCRDSYHWDDATFNHTLKASDFLKNGSFTCPVNSENKLTMCGTVTEINYTSSYVTINAVGIDACGYTTLPYPLNYAKNAKDDEGNPGHNNDEPTTPTTPTTPTNPGGSAGQEPQELDLDNFCTGSVQGVFTTIGWVFFIVKILVPIVLIILGSIDLVKAIVSSKEDELKKSIKTLVIRVIAGILIFFVPTLLDFAIKFFQDEDNVYNGTFIHCTSCMLNPGQDGCSTLMGGSSK